MDVAYGIECPALRCKPVEYPWGVTRKEQFQEGKISSKKSHFQNDRRTSGETEVQKSTPPKNTPLLFLVSTRKKEETIFGSSRFCVFQLSPKVGASYKLPFPEKFQFFSMRNHVLTGLSRWSTSRQSAPCALRTASFFQEDGLGVGSWIIQKDTG
jgi:hypothetical protein